MKKKLVFSVIFLSSLMIVSSSVSAFDWGGGGGGSNYITFKGYVKTASGSAISGAIVHGQVGSENFLTATNSYGYYEVSVYYAYSTTAYVYYQKVPYHKIKKTKSVSPGGTYRIDVTLTEFNYNIADPEPINGYGNLGTDWGRHPTNYDIINNAYNILYSKNPTTVGLSSYDAAKDIWEYVHTRWIHISMGNPGGEIRTDVEVVNSGLWRGPCYTTSNFLSGLYRAIGLPSRIILFEFRNTYNFMANEHAFVEVYTSQGWITTCANPLQGDWWNWEGTSSWTMQNRIINLWDWRWKYSDRPYPEDRTIYSTHCVYHVSSDAFDDYDLNKLWLGTLSIYHNYYVNPENGDWSTWDEYKTLIPSVPV